MSAHAPESICLPKICGAIVVLPCGASQAPRESRYACIAAIFASSALCRRTATGIGNVPLCTNGQEHVAECGDAVGVEFSHCS